MELGFELFKSLTDRQKITVSDKKKNRERIKRKLNEKSEQHATARFETENDNTDSQINLNLESSPL